MRKILALLFGLLLSSSSLAWVSVNSAGSIVRGTPLPPPSSVLDLSSWELTGPVNSAGELYYESYIRSGGSIVRNPICVSPDPPYDSTTCAAIDARSTARKFTTAELPGLSTYWFYTSQVSGVNYVNFESPVFGSPTTPSNLSNHARAELRGRITGTGATTGEWRRANEGQMTGDMIVRQVPNETGDIDICQIHPLGSKFFLIAILRSSGALQSKATDEAQGSSASITLASGVVVGDRIRYTIKYGPDDNVRWTIQVNNGSVSNFTQAVDSAWASTDMHFSAGTYSNTDVLDSSDVGAVSIGVLNPGAVADKGWNAYRSLTQTLLSP